MNINLFANKLSLFFLTLLLISGITLPFIATANTADWGLVQRFNKQNTLANAGNVKAMYDVGKLYERGRGVDKDIVKAVSWFQRAATAGNASAQARLGILYFEGRGVEQNYEKALKLLNSAAEKNIPSALFQLANMYELGTGVSQNLQLAVNWYKKADQFGYYLAKAKVERLQKILTTDDPVQRTPSPKAVVIEKKVTSPLIQSLISGRWFKRKTAIGYLPSNITNCAKDSHNTMHCISTSQERSTGLEVITYITESDIIVKDKTSFDIVYAHNVLDVALLETEDGDGNTIVGSASRIKKGDQGKKHTLQCNLKSSNIINCSKGSSTFDLIKQ